MIANKDTINRRYQFADLINQNGYKVGVEIGVDRGNYAHKILADSNIETYFLIDPWRGECLTHKVLLEYMGEGYEFVDNETLQEDYGNVTLQRLNNRFGEFDGRYKTMRMLSEDAISHFVDESLDFVYIDGDHSYLGCKSDVELWWPKLRKGGAFCGHDYKNLGKKKQVKKAVDEFFTPMGVTVNYTMKESCPSFWYVK
jgi:hypothetical protein